MNNGQIEQPAWQAEAEKPNSYPAARDLSGEVLSNWHLSYATKRFPLNSLVTISGKSGIYRVVSKPYIPSGYSYPHFDVEALGETCSVSVFIATRVDC
jgi:hypothetical protein